LESLQNADPDNANILICNEQIIIALLEASRCSTASLKVEILTAIRKAAVSLSAHVDPTRVVEVGLRKKVIDMLSHHLGDKKRPVRRAAAECRHQWFKL
jgi:hypothetical protein